jgi:hypothetical protein
MLAEDAGIFLLEGGGGIDSRGLRTMEQAVRNARCSVPAPASARNGGLERNGVRSLPRVPRVGTKRRSFPTARTARRNETAFVPYGAYRASERNGVRSLRRVPRVGTKRRSFPTSCGNAPANSSPSAPSSATRVSRPLPLPSRIML